MTSYSDGITDGIGSNDAQVIGFGVALSDAFRTPDMLAYMRAQSGSVSDNVGINDVISSMLGVIVTELIRANDALIANDISQLKIIEQIVATELVARGLPGAITDGIGLQFVLATAQLVAVIEQLGLTDVLAPAALFNLSVTDRVQLVEAIARFIGAGIIDGLQVVETTTGVALKQDTLTDAIDVTEIISPQLLFNAVVADGIDITDAELVRMIFSGAIAEGIELTAAYLGPNGSITTWAMNTRTAAVTEYTNYAFNSFARMGDIYLGATADGLYELVGDNDAGTSIIADLKSGLTQFEGAHLSSFKAAYIAARGGGSFVLRIFTGDGNQYDYAVTADNMKTARVDIGKGIRARYFAFELLSSGQDFDLESLEFVPLIAKRRV